MSSKRSGFSKYVRDMAFAVHGGQCANCEKPAKELHHRLPNTKTNQRLYPHLLNSIFNAVPMCHECHEQKSHLYHMTQALAIAYEQYLKVVWSPYVGSI
jgi:creatinine amidohydrolase/Fe(II)-dependent formamide hydrolase-like protein